MDRRRREAKYLSRERYHGDGGLGLLLLLALNPLGNLRSLTNAMADVVEL